MISVRHVQAPRRAGSLAGAIALCLSSVVAFGADADKEFNIPAQLAQEAVKLLARQADFQIAALAEELEDVRTNAVQGRYEPMEALSLLLAGTGLEVERTGADTVAIRRRKLAQSPAAEAGTPEALEVDEIIVTGTRIRRDNLDTLQATLTNDSELIQQRGYTNVAEVLNDTPGFSSATTNPIGRNQGSFSAGQSFVNLFGLGSQRTLTLVNGRRYVSSNTVAGGGIIAPSGSQVDLNTIPIDLIERVETIAIGGAPVYGSDAIAGTVNIILKDDFEGLRTDLQYGNSESGDTDSYSARALFGSNFADGRGNAVVSLEYNKQDGIVSSARDAYRRLTSNPNGSVPQNIVSRRTVVSGVTEGGLPYNPATFGYITSPDGTALQFASNGEFVPYSAGADLDGFPQIDFLSEGGDGIRFGDHVSLLSPTERYLANALGHFDIQPGLRVFAEASYARSEGSELSELGILAHPATGVLLPLSMDNAFLSTAVRNTFIANGVTDTFLMARNFGDLLYRGEGASTMTLDLHRVVLGVDGEFEAFGELLVWDFSLNYGRSRGVSSQPYLNDERFQNALDAVRDASGNIVCRVGGNCVPLNLFGQHAFSDAAADYVTQMGEAISTNTQKVATVNLAGRLPWQIGGAERISFNVGAEHRREDGCFEPDEILRSGFSMLGVEMIGPHVRTAGHFDTNEIYGELVTPLISPGQDVTAIKSLALEGAVRHVDNSVAGSDLTWSAGARFAPRLPGWGDGLLLRGVYTHSIRAPAITELFSGTVPTSNGITDPCDRREFQSGPNPAVREANCRAALAAVGIADPALFISTEVSPTGTISGNPRLENEKADSWSVGLVYQPALLPRFHVALDWSRIELQDGIETMTLQDLLNACYDHPGYPEVSACDFFSRYTSAQARPGAAAGDIADGFDSGYVNTSSTVFAGLTGSAEYNLDLQGWMPATRNPGSLRVGGKLFYNDKLETVTSEGAPALDEVGGSFYPKYRAQLNILYERGRLNLLLQTQWTSAVKFDLTADSTVLARQYNDIEAYWKFNGTIGFQFTDSVRAQLAVNNLLDTEPSEAQLLSGNYTTYDVLGRTYIARIGMSF